MIINCPVSLDFRYCKTDGRNIGGGAHTMKITCEAYNYSLRLSPFNGLTMTTFRRFTPHLISSNVVGVQPMGLPDPDWRKTHERDIMIQ